MTITALQRIYLLIFTNAINANMINLLRMNVNVHHVFPHAQHLDFYYLPSA